MSTPTLSGITLVNGVRDAGVPADDLGLTRGWSVFETLRTYGRTPFRLPQHLDRLKRSAELLHVPMPNMDLLPEDLPAAIATDVWIRITLTASGNRIVVSRRVDPARIGRPITVASVIMPPSPHLPAAAKHGCRTPWIMAARHHGTEEIFILDDQRHILEANRSNVIAFVDGCLWTPPTQGQCLDGITRQAMLQAAADANLPVRIAPLPVDTPFDELYVCSSLKELAPVATLDGVKIGGGPQGKRLHAAFRALVAKESHN